MSAENNRLPRCRSCRYWKSAAELFTERAPTGSTPEEVEAAKASIKADLSEAILNPIAAFDRGFCMAAEQGVGLGTDMYAVNIADPEPARAITSQDFGCVNHQPRPRAAMTTPPPDLLSDTRIARCSSCQNWSSADNEANALFSIYQFAQLYPRLVDAEREAYTRLSPPPLDANTAGKRGWCKLASVNTDPFAMVLSFDPETKQVGGMITAKDFGCIFNTGLASPSARTAPDYYWLANRAKLYHFGDHTPLDELYWAHGDAGQLLNPENINSPLNELNSQGLRNPRNLSFNPNPAFAAYYVNPSVVNVIAKKVALNSAKGYSTPGSSDGGSLTQAPTVVTVSAQQAASNAEQQQANAKLSASFSTGSGLVRRPSNTGNELMENKAPVRQPERRRVWVERVKRRLPAPKPGGGGTSTR